jgi:ABC-type multidrug transport system ATPase subunit
MPFHAGPFHTGGETLTDIVLRTIGLTKRYGSRLAVDNLNIEVYRGDVFGFLGPNGAGKSTVIRMILRLVFPTAGDVEIFGRSLRKERHHVLDRIGAIVEKPAFYGHLSAYRNLEILGGLHRRVPRRRILEGLEQVGLADRANDRVKIFSHGMNQRLGLALALLSDPELIILDEPTTGLDPQGVKDVRELIRTLAQKRGMTVFLSSHLLHEVEMTATRMGVIHEGILRAEGPVRDLLGNGDAVVTVRTDRTEGAIRFLEEHGGYPSTERITDGFSLKMPLARIPDLNRDLVLAGFQVHSLVPERSLETYFLNLVGD